jgi:hypothetical protein
LGEESELDVARAMIRLYGGDAEAIAMGHAETHGEAGDRAESGKWQRIAILVANLNRMGRARNGD